MITPKNLLRNRINITLETNGKGYIGFLVELPGGFIRGRTEQEALSKAPKEVASYLRWLGVEAKDNYEFEVVGRFESRAVVEDADTWILLDAEEGRMDKKGFEFLLDLVKRSGEDFFQLYLNAEHKLWVDETRIRRTFYTDNPATIQRMFDHVKNCQYYYLSKTGIDEEPFDDFIQIRAFCAEQLASFYTKHNNQKVFQVGEEFWTLKKVMRRFIWHDRIHGKSITRVLARQMELGLIEGYQDPFRFTD
ncbi:hypothetical protein JXM67_10960 [candidate division WOR-3 bacterium]|nr:hypothetical protein [candidate division WOR-3 bacterium]